MIPENVKPNVYAAGAALKDGKLVTSGGRVLGVTAVADTLPEAVKDAYALAEQQLGQRQTVAGFGQEHVGLVGLDFDLEGVSLCHHSFVHGYPYVVLQLMEQPCIRLGQLFLGGDADYLPVGLVHVNDDIGVLLVVAAARQLFCQRSHLVRIDDLSAHEHGLLD